jgi:cellulose synthase/poly-beta-1,6-N-acetylglucosamine synthase-like glycosyltransferase
VGARAATGDVLLFVDSDVVVHSDVVGKLVGCFADPGTTAVYGSYDARPPHHGFASQYMNLRHHFVHQTPSEDSPSFWAGLGAVRRTEYLAAGGFDSGTYTRPSVEDVELGMRLRKAGGRIRRCPDIQGTHLKVWTLRSVIHTDIFQRALPWSRMMLRNPGVFTELNVSLAERMRAVLALLLPGTILLTVLRVMTPWALLVHVAVCAAANLRLLAFFARCRGPLFAVSGLLFHQVYYMYGTLAYGWCLLEHWWGRRSTT